MLGTLLSHCVPLQSAEGAVPGEGPCHAGGSASADGGVRPYTSAALHQEAPQATPRFPFRPLQVPLLPPAGCP